MGRTIKPAVSTDHRRRIPLRFIASRRVVFVASALPDKRTAVVVDRDTPLGQLRIAQIPYPECKDDELLVEVHAASVNALDRVIAGAARSVPPALRMNPGLVPGKDISGVVVGLGSRVSGFREGDDVFGMTGFSLSVSAISQLSGDGLSRGAYATHTTLKADETAKKPPNITHIEAAGIPLAGLTAWKAIVNAARIREGSKLLILGGAGGVGTLATQLAKRYCKAGTVAVTCSESSRSLVTDCGADMVIDYKKERFDDVLKGADFDVVLDAVGYNNKFESAAAVLKPEKGRLIDLIGPPSIGYLNRGQRKDSFLAFVQQGLKYGSSVRYEILGVSADGPALRTLARLLEAGTVKPVVDKVYKGLGEVQAAFDYNESGASHGKVIISIKE